MSLSDLPYRPCVGMAVLNAENKVFIGRRKGGPEQQQGQYAWQMPQGGLDKGEEPLSAARRELYEETNMTSVSLIAEYPDWLAYDLPPELLGKAWKGKYRGQTQKWFVFRFEGDESEIDVLHPAKGAHKPEFVDWKWVEVKTLPDLIVPFKKDVYIKLRTFLRSLTG